LLSPAWVVDAWATREEFAALVSMRVVMWDAWWRGWERAWPAGISWAKFVVRREKYLTR